MRIILEYWDWLSIQGWLRNGSIISFPIISLQSPFFLDVIVEMKGFYFIICINVK